MDLSVIILTCDNNVDLAPFIKRTCDIFKMEGVDTLIVTESNESPYSGYKALCIPSKKFALRFHDALARIETKYVLVLLDDYFVYDKNLATKIKIWEKECEDSDFIALRISKNYHLFKSTKKDKQKTKHFKKLNFYDIDFHPTIWEKQHLLNLLSNKRDLSAWQIEPIFKLYLDKHNLKCGISSIFIKFDELVIQGKFFRIAYRKHVKKRYSGTRVKMKLAPSIKRYIKNGVYCALPRPLINRIKKISGKTYYSDLASL